VTELNDEQQTTEDISDSKKTSKSRSGLWFNIIILLVVLGLAAAGFYSLQSLQNQQKDLGGGIKAEVRDEMLKQLSGYQSQLTAIQSQVAHTAEKIDSKDEHFAKALETIAKTDHEQIDSARKELSESVAKIDQQLSKTRGYWLLADAEYLLSVANERLNLIGDVHTTIEALEAADERLKESGDAGVIRVREKIAEEIATLKTVSLPDIVGTYMAIQSLQEHVDKLNTLLPFAGKTPTTSEKSSEQTETVTENKGLFDMLGVKHSEQNINAIITPEQAIFIREQLRVKLEMVKIALSQHNEELYQSTLKDTKNWLEHNFAKDKVSQQFGEQLEKFASMKLRSQFPDINQSLKLLSDISKARIESDKLDKTIGNKATQSTNKSTVAPKPASETSAVDAVAPKPASETSAVDAVAPKPTSETSAVDAVAPKPTSETSAVDAVARKPTSETSAVDAVAPKPAPATSAVDAVAPKPAPATSAVDAVAPKPAPETSAVDAVAPKPAPATSAVDAVAPKPAPATSAVDGVAPKPAPETSAVDAVAPKPAPETSAVDAVAPKPAPETSAVDAVAPKPAPATSAVDAVAPKPAPATSAVENKKRNSSPSEAVSTKPQVKKPK
jgi:uncharacterized protein HemX